VHSHESAAVPLGTDEEAAGSPIDLHLLAVVRRRETARRPRPARNSLVSQEMDWPAVAVWIAVVLGLAIGVSALLLWA